MKLKINIFVYTGTKRARVFGVNNDLCVLDVFIIKIALAFGDRSYSYICIATESVHMSYSVIDGKLCIVIICKVVIIRSNRLLYRDYIWLFYITSYLFRTGHDGIEDLLTCISRKLLVIFSKYLL